MKKSIFITVVLFVFMGISNQLLAQEAIEKTRTKSNQTNEKAAQGQHIKDAKLTCRVSATESGCSIVFENSPSSSATGMTASKKGYDYYKAQSFSVSSSDNSVSEVVSPRDAATGQSSGKRQHKPTTVSKEYDKSSPKLMEKVANGKSSSDSPQSEIAIDEPEVHKVSTSGQGAGKVNVQDISFSKVSFKDFTIVKRCGGKTTKISCESGDCEIPTGDCPNGDCVVTAEWSWGASQSGSSKRCSVDFVLKIEDGACTSMAINEKGLPVEKKIKKTNTPK